LKALCANDGVAVPLAAFPPFLTFERCSPHGECICTRSAARPVRRFGSLPQQQRRRRGGLVKRCALAQVCEIRLAPCNARPGGLSSSPFSTHPAPRYPRSAATSFSNGNDGGFAPRPRDNGSLTCPHLPFSRSEHELRGKREAAYSRRAFRAANNALPA